jgi:serine/threonine protein kinase
MNDSDLLKYNPDRDFGNNMSANHFPPVGKSNPAPPYASNALAAEFGTNYNPTIMNHTLVQMERELSIPGFLLMDMNTAIRKEEAIGQGGEGILYLATPMLPALQKRLSDKKIVVKEITTLKNADENAVSAFLQEVAIMWLMRDSPYIAQIVGYTDNPYSILMRFYPLGSLKNLLTRREFVVSREMFISVLQDVARGISECHRNGVAHLDIKPANYLLEEHGSGLRVVLTDFGISTVVTKEALLVKAFNVRFRRGLTISYCSPEILSGRPPKTELLLAADVYSYSMILVTGCIRRLPWW